MENGKDKELPSGWVEIDFADSCHKISLNGIKVKEKEYKESGLFPTVDQGQKLIGGYFDDPFLVVPMEPPYIIFGDHTKVKKFINFRFIAGGDGLKVLKAKEFFNPSLLYYFMHVIKLPDKGYARHFQYLDKSKIPLPPLAEQHRIVAKIEELFSELDKGVENLRAAQQQLKVYRQAVLQWAFEGKLTEEWRKTDWQWSSLGDFAEDIKIGPFGTMLHESDYVLHGIPVINPKHIKNQRIHPDPRNAVAQAKADDLSAYKLRENDVLLGRRGEMGRTAYVTNKEAGWLCGTGSMIIRLRKNNLAKIYSMILSEKRVKDQLEHNSTGTTMNNLNEKIVKAVSVPVIPIPEQQQIVAEIESRLSVCDKLEETIAQSLLQAEALRQSILKQAFAGKLVPQDPSDEPAEKLLARIRAERAATTPVKKPSKGRTAK